MRASVPAVRPNESVDLGTVVDASIAAHRVEPDGSEAEADGDEHGEDEEPHLDLKRQVVRITRLFGVTEGPVGLPGEEDRHQAAQHRAGDVLDATESAVNLGKGHGKPPGPIGPDGVRG
ncbi:hypothetical protein IT414_02810 [bacterium]|nr:hypothetical protein [bacterium]